LNLRKTNPTGTFVDTLGTDKFLWVTDSDTPYISMSIRLLSIGMLEVHYPSYTKPLVTRGHCGPGSPPLGTSRPL